LNHPLNDLTNALHRPVEITGNSRKANMDVSSVSLKSLPNIPDGLRQNLTPNIQPYS
jgi:hypothetical protein